MSNVIRCEMPVDYVIEMPEHLELRVNGEEALFVHTDILMRLWGRTKDYSCSVYGDCISPLCKHNGECSFDNRLKDLGIEVPK